MGQNFEQWFLATVGHICHIEVAEVSFLRAEVMRKYDSLFIKKWLAQIRQRGELHLLLTHTHLFPLSTVLNISKLFSLLIPWSWRWCVPSDCHYVILKPRRKCPKIGYGYVWDPNVLFWCTRIILCHNYFVCYWCGSEDASCLCCDALSLSE